MTNPNEENVLGHYAAAARTPTTEERLSMLAKEYHAPTLQQAYLEMSQRLSDLENVVAETHNQMRVIIAGRGKEKPVVQTDLGP